MATFAAGETLGRVTPRVTAYLMKIKPAVEALDAELAGAFDGAKASEALSVVKEALDGADTTHEVSQSGLPEQTLSIYEVKGRVLEGVEDLNRAAKIAFDGRAELAGKFNKDILLRARKSRAKKGQGSGQSADRAREPVAPQDDAPSSEGASSG